MHTWEYASILSDEPASRDTLNELGADGWELVSVVQGSKTLQLLYVFKRPRATVPVSPALPVTGPGTA